MNSPYIGLRTASVLFGLVCFAHLVRWILGVQILVGSHAFPDILAFAVIVISAALCAWLWWLSRGVAGPASSPPASVTR